MRDYQDSKLLRHSYQRAGGSREAVLCVRTGLRSLFKLNSKLASTEELIALAPIDFFNSKWHFVSTKASLRHQLANITRIDPQVLEGESPTKRPIVERMSQASEQTTSRIGAIAYSLMGIFRVFLPMLYGEEDLAFIRLQEEIMKRSEDYTIFAWKSTELGSSSRGIFARSPSEFTNRLHTANRMPSSLQTFSQYIPLNHHVYDPATLNSRDLLITLPLLSKNALERDTTGETAVERFREEKFRLAHRLELRAGMYLASICRINSGPAGEDENLCIWLRKHANSAGGMFSRESPNSIMIRPAKRACDFNMYTIYAIPFESMEEKDEDVMVDE
jgi:hypothetical protein